MRTKGLTNFPREQESRTERQGCVRCRPGHGVALCAVSEVIPGGIRRNRGVIAGINCRGTHFARHRIDVHPATGCGVRSPGVRPHDRALTRVKAASTAMPQTQGMRDGAPPVLREFVPDAGSMRHRRVIGPLMRHPLFDDAKFL